MGSLTRAPRVKKPSKGMKNYLKQGLRAFKKAVALAAGPTKKKTSWINPKAARYAWLNSFSGGHTPHQGHQEKARRVRQMANHTHGY